MRQPFDLTYAPPRYPSHGYIGNGTVVRVHTEDGLLVGHLSTAGEPPNAVGWDAAPIVGSSAYAIHYRVMALLREGAAHRRPLGDVLAQILAEVPHDEPEKTDLARLR
jgi:hypothetical protein